VDGVIQGGYKPVNVWYAGVIKFEAGKLLKWKNSSGITGLNQPGMY
jgi:hypothetical protein